ncbi:MAG TPA: four helix bundle protein [Rhodanobacteraceae bacterium]|nr:four helix bundle protein [Rhodanobacteraceae bacterium]
MAPVSDYRELKVWQEALVLAELVYGVTKRFPGDERYGLTSQLMRKLRGVHKLLHAMKRAPSQKDTAPLSPFPVPRSRSSN